MRTPRHRSAVRTMVVGGLRLLCVATRLEREFRVNTEEQIKHNRLLRRILSSWLGVVVRGSPFRVVALRQLRLIKGRTWLSKCVWYVWTAGR